MCFSSFSFFFSSALALECLGMYEMCGYEGDECVGCED